MSAKIKQIVLISENPFILTRNEKGNRFFLFRNEQKVCQCNNLKDAMRALRIALDVEDLL